MAENNQTPIAEYPGFEGTVAETFSKSTPWWPDRVEAPRKAPNIVFIIVDDLGYSDLGCYGSEISTPNIDALAGRGLRYTNFHVTPLCSPTRAALMTGRNPHSVGVGMVANIDAGFPGYTGELPRNQPTMAEMLRDNGYSTLMVGKWHLCKDADYSEAGDKHSWPLQRGFEQYYGFLEALTNFWHPHRLYEGNSVVHVDRYPDDYYLTDDLTDRAVRMIREVKTANPAQPFFLYFAHGAVHAPLHTKQSDIQKYKGVYDRGWDAIREQRLARQKELIIVPPDAQLPPRNSEAGHEVSAWDELSPEQQRLYAKYMEVYAGMVDNVDQSVGRVVDAVRELGELDNTIFVFTSDNGASREGNATGTRAYFSNSSSTPGGHGDHAPEDFENLDAIGGPTTWPHYPRGWAMACNTPFRLYKITTMRGGHTVPFVLSWPDKISSRGDVFRRQFTHITDIMPTIADLVGVVPPTSRHGVAAEPLHGVSFAESIADSGSPTKHTEQHWECIGNRAFYRDGWEVVTTHVARTSFKNDHWQLFDAQNDFNQLHDVSAQNPDKVRELVAAWEVAAKENQVYPLADGFRSEHIRKSPYEEPYARRVRLVPGTPTLERVRSARLTVGRSFDIVVNWNYLRGDEGIVVAHGGQHLGYVIFVRDGMLHFHANCNGKVTHLEPVPLGDSSHTFTVQVEAPGKRQWRVAMNVDGVQYLQQPGFVQPFNFLPWEGIDIGADRRSPVSWEIYERHGCFPFTGHIVDVTYEPGDFAPDEGPQALEAAIKLGLDLD
ncbi:MAG: arylsulfatase [Actinomycetota bacterium]